jgi:TonB family protein
MTPVTESERKPQRPSSLIDPWPKSSQRKRCPKCNAVYNSELIAYCAVDMTPLVDANLPVGASPQATTTPLIWTLVGAAFIASAVFTYFISGYVSKVERVSTPATAPPPKVAEVKKAMPVVGGELAGKALTLPEPEYPPTARSEGVGGTILVRVKVDEKGRVISARSFEGDWRLRAEAVKAATRATFSPEKLNGTEATGTIVYTFKP